MRWTEGVCGDGAAILCEGEMVPIEQVLDMLNARAARIVALELEMEAMLLRDADLVLNVGGKPGRSGAFQ